MHEKISGENKAVISWRWTVWFCVIYLMFSLSISLYSCYYIIIFFFSCQLHIPMTPKSNWQNYEMWTRLADIWVIPTVRQKKKNFVNPQELVFEVHEWDSSSSLPGSLWRDKTLLDSVVHCAFIHLFFFLSLFSSFSVICLHIIPSLARQKLSSLSMIFAVH